MNTKELTREQISALADGELPEEHQNSVFAALRRREGKADWDIYHQLGDLLRSDDMDVKLSPGFASRLSARLDAEPTIVVPAVITTKETSRESVAGKTRKWAVPSVAAAAAMATVAFFTTPQLMVAIKGAPSAGQTAESIASAPVGVVAESAEGVVLRDPRIDDYLMAHQRISPSVYSSAQFARSANFAADSNK